MVECGFHLIYSEEHQQNQDDEDNHIPMFSNLPENSENVKRRLDDEEHNQAEETS